MSEAGLTIGDRFKQACKVDTFQGLHIPPSVSIEVNGKRGEVWVKDRFEPDADAVLLELTYRQVRRLVLRGDPFALWREIDAALEEQRKPEPVLTDTGAIDPESGAHL